MNPAVAQNGTLPGNADETASSETASSIVKVCTYDQGGLDGSLAHILAEGIGLSVTVVEARDGGHPLVVQATSDPHRVHTEQASGAATVRQALALPAGGIAVWSAPADHAERIGRHAMTLLELEISRNETKQLLAEVDSLTNQVMQDFEELSLIRALASSLELPQTEEDTDGFVLASLMPLVSGVGAVSIAAILVDDSGRQQRRPLWTGTRLIQDESVLELIQSHAAELSQQPVVRNRNIGDQHCGVAGLDEYVIVECSSEGRLHGWVMACNRVKDDVDDVPWAQLGFTTVQASLMETATNQLAAQLNNIRLLRQKEELFTDVIRALVNAVEARDPYTCGHSERVASFARCLASKIGFTSVECERIYLTGLLHDVGKIAIPDGVLQKPNRLNDEERAIIETHTDSGWRILQELDALQDILPGVLYHHEHWNGEGYPDQLAGENIPIDGRILAVCDAFDAMTSDRPYRKGMSIDRAVAILNDGAGTFWDPNLIQVFHRYIDEINEIRINHQPRQPATRPAPVDGRPIIGTPGFTVPAETPQPSTRGQ
ncbi:HD-GYP domain-containing protein [Planctomycetes bacterium TBK1r]|uniref:Cyclic di-GMP phosphodiesterase response regulator RpfG n=1 Tax=Stieleria magnilauensis TaxID=2527963 RepID=A0ABX5Y0B5_9BACT|nr:Cyclic di-GMP phosphodiesterase response regulator RpfG [Planctomycetes bacterium TBK1r]